MSRARRLRRAYERGKDLSKVVVKTVVPRSQLGSGLHQLNTLSYKRYRITAPIGKDGKQ